MLTLSPPAGLAWLSIFGIVLHFVFGDILENEGCECRFNGGGKHQFWKISVCSGSLSLAMSMLTSDMVKRWSWAVAAVCLLAVRCSWPVWTETRTGGGWQSVLAVAGVSIHEGVRCSCMILHTNNEKAAHSTVLLLRLVCLWPVPPLPLVLQVDGMDVLCVREATKFAADYCRSGKVSWASVCQETTSRDKIRQILATRRWTV